jgi:lysophospholipase L1-like esterase
MKKMKMKKGLLINLATALVSILVVLLLAEAGMRAVFYLRDRRGGSLEDKLERSRRTAPGEPGQVYNMTGLVQPSPWDDIVYELKPNQSGIFRDQPFSINSHGFRGPEYLPEKEPGTFRIVGLGDSVMFGWGVGQEEFYLHLLEEELNGQYGGDLKFEVLDFAVPGYNTAIEVAVLEHKALAFDPDLVIIEFVNNDYGLPLFMQKPRDAFALKRSYLAEFIASRFRRAPGGGTDLIAMDFRNYEGEDRSMILEQYQHMVGEEGFKRAMNRLGRLTRERDIPVIVTTGVKQENQGRTLRKVVNRLGFNLLYLKPYSDAYVKRSGIEDTPEARKKALWVSPSDHHPNARGHTIWIDALTDKLRELEVIK